MSADTTVLEMAVKVATSKQATPQANSVIEGLSSAEVRWVLPGHLDAALIRWLERFPAGMDSREDAYLIHPLLRGLSVKIREGRRLEVKLHNGSAGILNTAGRARGLIEAWQKWSFPIGLLGPDEAGPPSWTVVHKRRWIIRFQLVSGRIMVDVPEQAAESVCAVELTEVRIGGETWWSLGFEATGPSDSLCNALQRTAALMFAEIPPGGVELDMSHSHSYADWLSQHRESQATHTRGLRLDSFA